MQKSPTRPDGSFIDPSSSSIFAAKINDSDQLSFDEDINMLKPHITIGYLGDNSAPLSMDGQYIVLKSRKKTIPIDKDRGMGSDIVVLNANTLEEKYRIAPKKSSMISRASFGTDNSIFYIEMIDGNYNLVVFDFLNLKSSYSKELNDLAGMKYRSLNLANN